MDSETEILALGDINLTLLMTGKWSDVTLVVGENQIISAHKNILASRSSVFTAIFKLPLGDRLPINVHPDVVEKFIVFLYTGWVPRNLNLTMAQDLLLAAEEYQVGQLKAVCEQYLCSVLSYELVPTLMPFAVTVNSEMLLQKCMMLLSGSPPIPLPPPPPPPPFITRVPDLCLKALFRQMTTRDQMVARQVCASWAFLVTDTNRRSRTLALVVNKSLNEAADVFNSYTFGPDWKLIKLLKKPDGSPQITTRSLNKWNSFELETHELNADMVSQMTATFPKVKELQIYARITLDRIHSDCCPPHRPLPDYLVRLLKAWRIELVTLKLDLWISTCGEAIGEPVVRPSCLRLSSTINRLPFLNNLSFDLRLNNLVVFPNFLRIFNRLEHFNSTTFLTPFLDASRKLMHFEHIPFRLPRIAFDGTMPEEYLPPFFSMHQDIRRAIVHLGCQRLTNFRAICTNFPSLTSLGITLLNASYREFFNNISQLSSLANLQLCINFPTILPDPQRYLLLPQLNSIKVLQLIFCRQVSHRDLEPLHLGWTMPSLQVITFEMNDIRCEPCGITKFGQVRKKVQCLRLMFGQLKRQCSTSVHTIQYDLEGSYGTVEKLLAVKKSSKRSASESDEDGSPAKQLRRSTRKRIATKRFGF